MGALTLCPFGKLYFHPPRVSCLVGALVCQMWGFPILAWKVWNHYSPTVNSQL